MPEPQPASPRTPSDLLLPHLEVAACPHCGISRPNLARTGDTPVTWDHTKHHAYRWAIYACSSCGQATLVGVEGHASGSSYRGDLEIKGTYPPPRSVAGSVPDRARSYLLQALGSLSAPDGAVMLAASAVDAMLKAKNLTDGSLYSRIKTAADTHLITADMEGWAHEVRLDANDTRHADHLRPHHTTESAQRVVDFALALAEFLFVLPARVTRGRDAAKEQTSNM
jgi:hypothetical protein